MVVREDGTKWACNSCLKGHRVSGCNHTDRELKLVPKKGRPITQCQHCRQERKKRSAHVKCDCADDKTHHTKEKCIHLKEAEERAKIAGYHDDSHLDPAHLATVAEEQGCCCHHGGKCSCALLQRKDSTDDDDAVPRHKPAVKPRLETTRSDGSLTVINGHHKPIHRKNHAAHESGMPYKIPLSRSKTDQEIALVARRSVDSLALDNNSRELPIPRQHSKSSCAPRIAEMHAESDGLTSNKLGMVDFSELGPVRTNDSINSNLDDLTSFPAFDPNLDSTSDAWPLVSADIQMPNNNPFGVWPTNADISLAQPALTAASSGTQSEIDEIPSIEDIYVRGMPSIDENAFDIVDTANTGSPQTNRRSLPPNFFGNIDFTMPDLDEDWQNVEASGMLDDKSPQPFTFTDPWQNSRQTQASGRPTALSVGASTNPGNDIMKQLFPGMDLDNAQASDPMNIGSEGNNSPAGKAMSDVGAPFTTQAWSDGLSVPNDAFGVPFDEEDFSNQQFNAQMWNQ